MTPEQEQEVKAELKQRHKESSEFLDTCIAKEEQELALVKARRAEWHGVIAEAINYANSTQQFSNSDLMDVQEIITEQLIKSGLMNTEEKDKFNLTVQIWACNDKKWFDEDNPRRGNPRFKNTKSSYLPNAESVDGRR
jgi:hypothetical protein